MTTHTSAGWLERQKGVVLNHVMVLMQAEVERFHARTSLLHDYYHARIQEITSDDSVVLVSMPCAAAIITFDWVREVTVGLDVIVE